MEPHGLDIRTAAAADLDRLTSLFTDAFREDPVWSWAFPGGDGMDAWWRLFIGSALRYPCVWILGDYAAASVWIPPGGVELTEAEEQRIAPLLRELVGARADAVLDLVQRFEDAHPRGEPHHYLSLLATAPLQRGQGLGMALLRANLRRIDEDGAPAYLESTNPANDRR